jgi:thiol-disulfide isomerase/thioredoxin
MRARSAPEARGFSYTYRRIGKAATQAWALACLTWAPISAALVLAPQRVHSEPVADSSLRRLTAASSAALPAFTLPNLAGVAFRLEERHDQLVLVHFFATWCEPCREELASLSRLQQGEHGARVAVVAVNVAEVSVRVRRFIEAAPVTFPVVLDADRAVTRAWGVSVLPTTFVLDSTLQPKLFVEGDLDWTRPDILSALAAVSTAPTTETPTPDTSTGRSE